MKPSDPACAQARVCPRTSGECVAGYGQLCQARIAMKARTELIRALVEPELQAQLRRAAEEQDRSLSYTVHEILAAWAQQQRQQTEQAA